MNPYAHSARVLAQFRRLEKKLARMYAHLAGHAFCSRCLFYGRIGEMCKGCGWDVKREGCL